MIENIYLLVLKIFSFYDYLVMPPYTQLVSALFKDDPLSDLPSLNDAEIQTAIGFVTQGYIIQLCATFN